MESEPLLAGSINYGSQPNNNDPIFKGSTTTKRLSYSVSAESCCVEGDDEDLYLQQAIVFIEDAIQYRSINHRVDPSSLRLYRWYYSRIWQWGLGLTIALVLMLAFVERPSSLSYTSDPRFRTPPWEPPCGLTEGIEIVCLIIFTIDFATKSYLIGWEEFRKCLWLIFYIVVISASIIDWTLSLSMECDESLRVRRLIRPFFLLQNSSLMKKTLKCIKRTLPEIDPDRNGEWQTYFRDLPTSLSSLLVLLTTANNPDVMIPAYSINRGYSIFFILFSGFGTYFLMNLLTAIIYNQFRGYLLMSIQASILRRRLGIRAAFEVLSCEGITSYPVPIRERVRVDAVLQMMARVQMKSYCRHRWVWVCQSPAPRLRRHGSMLPLDRLQLFSLPFLTQHPPKPEYGSPILQRLQTVFSHPYITVVGNAVALGNVMCICTVLMLDSEKSVGIRDDYYMEVINLFFTLYYLLEMSLKMFAFGCRGYLSYRNNIFDGLLTICLLIVQIIIFATYGFPHPKWNPASYGLLSLWEMVRLVNMLIVFRFLRIIPDIKLMALVASTLVDLVKNLRAFAGILVVVFYVFAVFGIWLFQGAISAPGKMSMENVTINFTMECGSYEQLGYWPNNFDDFASSLVLLYNVMVVNNWQVFMDAYSRYTTEWSKVYFVSWWLTSSVMWVNLFVALILENFIYKWDRSVTCPVEDIEWTGYESTVQLMFREHIQEPTEEELLSQLHQHPHLNLTG
uniref:Ion transport domain-containing protein n=1 Tax=Esox lucius TaxID=8010 RepID=A0A3P9AIW2_ESOLU